MPLSKTDKDYIRETIIEAITENNKVLFSVLASKQDLEKIEQELTDKISHLPTKDEFYESQDELVTELKALREEVEISNQRSADNRNRIERIEAKLALN